MQMTAGKSPDSRKKSIGEVCATWLAKLYNSLAKRSLVPLLRLLQRCGWPYRFVSFYGERIGHLAIEPDLFIKEGVLGMRPTFKEIWLVSRSANIANRCLLSYWAKHIRVVQSPLLAWLLRPCARDRQLSYNVDHYLVALNQTSLYPRMQIAWQERPPLLCLEPADAERGWKALRSLGIPEGAWFVCVHNREAGFSPSDDASHTYRNASIESYFPAMQLIAEQGGWCVRMGDKSMRPLRPMPQVIDYAFHEAKSQWMDVFLCAQARCFLGCSSGLAIVSTVFGVPVGMANQVPLANILPPGSRDLGIPKLYWSNAQKRLLTFREVFSESSSNYRFTHLYAEAGITLVDNSPDEICELGRELLEIAAGTVHYTSEEEQLQKRFKALMRPGHYSFGAKSRISRYFLRKHSHLLADA